MGLAPVNSRLSRALPHVVGLGARGRALAALQALQILTGLAGQVLLLARWSPHAETDLYLVLSSVPWMISAAALVGGLEMALPAAFHRALASGGESGLAGFLRQTTVLAFLMAVIAALGSGAAVAGLAARSGLEPGLRVWMGVALGGQVVPAALGGLWRGVLVARDQLARARLTMLAGSLLMVVGYALLPGPPAVGLPLAASGSVLLSALLAYYFARAAPGVPARSGWKSPHPGVARLVNALVALGAAAGLVHLQAVVERAAVLPLGTGTVAAFSVASRGWEAVLALIVAACVMPAYPRWADSRARGRHRQARMLLRWSLARVSAFSLVAAGAIGLAVAILAPWLERALGWRSGAQAARMALVLLPRFVLLTSIQPLALKQYAQGTPWYPVLGSALGLGVVVLGALTLIPRWRLGGVALTTAAGVAPGWVVLGWRALRETGRCAS